MPATKKTNTTKATKKTTAVKTTKRKAPVKKAAVTPKKKQVLKSLRMAPNEKHAFMLISTDFDGKKNKVLQVLSTLILLGILGTMIYIAVVANDIAQTLIQYGGIEF